jgi:hypothetical protein
MKWIEVADESNWAQVREIFDPAAQRIRGAGLHAEVLIRRGNPADESSRKRTPGARIVSSSARKEREASIAYYWVAFPPQFQLVPIVPLRSSG